jgi:hypothetical protein
MVVTPERLNSRQSADNGVLFGHVGDSPGVRHGDNSLETFRDHGDGIDESR